MPLAEAKALGGKPPEEPVRFDPHDCRPDCAALRQLAVLCQQFTPLVALEEAEQPTSLLLDITGCGPVFGGEEALARKVVDAFSHRGYAVRVAIADTVGTAWALAHAFSRPGSSLKTVIVAPEEHGRIGLSLWV